MTPRRKPKPLTANQLVAANLRRIREQRGLTQDEAAKRLEPYLGVLWKKATFSAAERSAVHGSRAREFTADELLAFALAFDVSVSWFFLPLEYQEDLPAVSCGGSELIEPPKVIDAALPGRVDPESHTDVEGPRLRALTRRFPSEDTRIRRGALARIEALTVEARVANVDEHALNLRRAANALEMAEDAARALFIAAYDAQQEKGNDDA